MYHHQTVQYTKHALERFRERIREGASGRDLATSYLGANGHVSKRIRRLAIQYGLGPGAIVGKRVPADFRGKDTLYLYNEPDGAIFACQETPRGGLAIITVFSIQELERHEYIVKGIWRTEKGRRFYRGKKKSGKKPYRMRP